jgi:hypothetical protein
MPMDDEHDAVNRAWWDERAPAHASSPDYAVQELITEHDSVPWEALPGRIRRDDGEWRLIEHPERLPLSYTLHAVKR